MWKGNYFQVISVPNNHSRLVQWKIGYRISRTYWLFLAPENAPFWSIQAPEAFLELKGSLNAHFLDFSSAGNCTFLEFLGTWYLWGLFGVKRGLKLTHFGIFWPQIMNLFGVFREAFLAFFWHQKMHLFEVFWHLKTPKSYSDISGSLKSQKGAFSGARIIQVMSVLGHF